MNTEQKVALIDLDGTVADYDTSLRNQMEKLRAPEEPPYEDRLARLKRQQEEPAYLYARRQMIQRQPGFWRNLDRLDLGFEVIEDMRDIGFELHVLTKGPRKSHNAWSEKVEWVDQHMPGTLVTISSDKSLVYGRVLFDDWPDYFLPWLTWRPRGLVVCLAHPWNEEYAKGGSKEHPNIFRYDGTNRTDLYGELLAAFHRGDGRSRTDVSNKALP